MDLFRQGYPFNWDFEIKANPARNLLKTAKISNINVNIYIAYFLYNAFKGELYNDIFFKEFRR